MRRVPLDERDNPSFYEIFCSDQNALFKPASNSLDLSLFSGGWAIRSIDNAAMLLYN
nr:hypothetical protein Q903MT_gene3428 [Picea sitchensis]